MVRTVRRSPLSAFAGERPPPIGHNQGPPLDASFTWRRHVWTKARKDLVPRLPLEVVRRRVRRAAELGLEYPQYASILLGTGRDIVGFLFTCDALGLHLQRTGTLPDPVARKLDGLNRCDRLVGAAAPIDPDELRRALAEARFREVIALPREGTASNAGRDAILAGLKPLALPRDGVVMVGTAPHERKWAEAAQMAKFLPAAQFFPTVG